MNARGSGWVSTLLLVGLAVVFVGERLVGAGTPRGLLFAIGAAAVVTSLVLRLLRAGRVDVQRRAIERMLAIFAGLGVLGLFLYFLQSDLVTVLGMRRLSESAPRLALVLAASYPIDLLLAIFPTVLGEMAYAAVAGAPKVEVRRIGDAVLSGVGMVAVIVFAFATAYVADVRDPTWDLAYSRTSKPSEATRRIVRGLDQPLEVALFFPPGSDVALEVGEYFKGIEPESTRLQVAAYDAAVDLSRARELSVVNNGTIVFKAGARKESVVILLELERARADLRKLDQTVQDKLFALTRPRRTVYLTSGHGERGTDKAGVGPDARGRIGTLKKELDALNQDVKTLSAAEGLAGEVPGDAAAVLIVGPTSAFLPEELAALSRYFTNGGRLLVAVDPDSATDLSPLLATLGLTFQKTTLANDRFFVPRTRTPSDRTWIATVGYSSHPSATSVGVAAGKPIPTFFGGAGYLEEAKAKPAQVTIDFVVRALPSTYDDKNGNLEYNPPAEAQKAWPLVAAAARKTLATKPGEKTLDARALVFADSDGLADGVIDRAQGNAVFAFDGLKWLIGEEAVVGSANKETDVRIEHTKGTDTAYFYVTVVGVPALVLIGGVLGTRSRRRRIGPGRTS